jgi:hypothetical protein
MRELAGDRGIDAALDARAPAGAPPHESSDQAERRGYLSEMRRGARAL